MANLLSTSITGTAITSGSVVIGGNFTNNPYNSVSSTRLLFGGGNEPNNYFIGTNLENYGGNYTKLDLRWHTGIRMGARPEYGGIRFFNNEALGSRIMSIGETDANVRIDNNLYIGGAGGWITDLLAGKLSTGGTAANSSQLEGFSAYALVTEARGVHSGSDFPNGTLVTTDINANGWAGDSFIMEVSGKSYGSGTPFKLIMEGYLYADTIINVSAMSYGYYFPAPVKVMRYNGNIAFWWPRGSYWNSFEVHVRAAGGDSWNRVTGITDSVDPASADKKISITPTQVIHTGNIASQSVSYAVTSGTSSATTQTNFAELFIENVAVATKEFVTSQGYLTSLPSHNHDDRYLVKGGSWYGSGLPGSRWGGFGVSGGEIVFGDGLPNAGQMGILIDGAYLAGENNGFWSLASDNSWGSRRGMYWDGTYLNFTTNTPPAIFSDVRAPIFYDSSNTGYYGAFANTSNINRLTVNHIGVGQSVNTNYRIITSGDYYANAGGNYWAEGRFKQYRGSGTWHDVIDSGNIRDQSVNYASSAGSSSNSNHLNTTRDTPSNSLQYWQAPGLGLNEAPSGDWHNTIRMGHGSPLSYYSNTLAVRMTGSGVGDIYTQTIMNGSMQGWKKHWNDGNMDAPNKSGTSYYQTNTWMQFNGSYGLYWPGNYGGHFRPNDQSSYCQFTIQGNKNGYGGIYDDHSRVNGFMYDGEGNGGVYREANSLWYFYYHLGNNCMGIGTSSTSSSYKLYVNGTIYATGDVIAYSDSRKKTNIVTIDNALNKVLSMRGVFYDKVDEPQKGRQVGVIAQEVNQVLPEAVSYASDIDEYGVKYGNIVGVLIEAIKEQQAQINELKAKLDGLTN